MSPKKHCILEFFLLILIFSSVLSTPASALEAGSISQPAPISLTSEEQQYIKDHPVVTIAFMQGFAPVIYLENGEAKGIMRKILDNVSLQTGLTFQYEETKGITRMEGTARTQKVDVFGGMTTQYLPEEFENNPRSKTFLTSQTAVFMHNGVDASNLSDYTFAAVTDGLLPAGVDESKVKFYPGREATMEAVEKGEADYCFGNEFSIAYYTIKNGYKNIITIPQKMESREYFFLYLNTDERLISIISKALDNISESELQSIILQSASEIDRKISLPQVINTYGKEIILILFATILLFLLLLLVIYRSYSLYKGQVRQYHILSDLSGEYIYQYDVKKDLLSLSGELSSLLGVPHKIENFRKSQWRSDPQLYLNDLLHTDKAGYEIAMVLEDGETGMFRVVNFVMHDRGRKTEFIIGKLTNIREEKEKIKALHMKAQTDGLTGLYNPDTTRTLIKEACSLFEDSSALFVIDVDNFKKINDTYGHPAGDKVLGEIARALKVSFRNADIVGRIGGDEFCIFMTGGITEELISHKCSQIARTYTAPHLNSSISVTVSIGVAFNPRLRTTFAELYKSADEALYHVKRNGRNNYHITVMQDHS
ncbi:MAG: GGDEF domain-containing protein [Lacrimispora sp.]|uniref:transporter substrate-binding domain-containing diguanylate cyclase n=1 Tax=Lacrimispora sp. TaxID=2719234 RepID=UPI0039E24E26